MKKFKIVLALVASLFLFQQSYADECSNDIQNFSVSDEVSTKCIESMKKTDLFMSKIQKVLAPENIKVTYSTISQLKDVVFVMVDTGDKFVNQVIYAVAGFANSFNAVGLIIVLLVVVVLIKAIFVTVDKKGDLARMFGMHLTQLLISLSASLTYISLVGVAGIVGYDFYISTSYKLSMTNTKIASIAHSIKDEITAGSTYKANEILRDVLKSSSCEYKRDKELAFNSSFDGFTKFKGSDYLVCMSKETQVQDNPTGFYNTKYFRQIRNCSLSADGVEHLSCGSIDTRSNHKEISSFMSSIEPLLLEFAYKLDTYTCNNTSSIKQNDQFFIDGKNCVDYDPYSHEFSLTDGGRPKLTDKIVSHDDLEALVKQIHYAIVQGNKFNATNLADTVEIEKKKITVYDVPLSLLTQNKIVNDMKDKAGMAYDYSVNYIDEIQYSEAKTSGKDNINQVSNELRTNQVIDELTSFAEGKDKGLDIAFNMIAAIGGDGYLKSSGYNTNGLYDFNRMSTLFVATLDFAQQSFNLSLITGTFSKVVELYGSKSDSEIPNTTALTIEQGSKLLANMFFWVTMIAMGICLVMFTNVAKMIMIDAKNFFFLIIKSITIIPIIIFIDVMFKEVSWKNAILERLMLLFYIFLKLFLNIFKYVLIMVVLYIVYGEFLECFYQMDSIIGLFGKDNNSFSGILHNVIMAAFMMIMAAWLIARTMRSIEEQVPSLETVYVFGSASMMNYNLNGNANKNAFNGYYKGGKG